MKVSLASKLNNRIEIWGKKEVDSDIGTTYEEILLKKVWADITPANGTLVKGQANTEYSNTRFKIRIRKTEISNDNFIIFKGAYYEIDYIYPDFNGNKFIDIAARLRTE